MGRSAGPRARGRCAGKGSAGVPKAQWRFRPAAAVRGGGRRELLLRPLRPAGIRGCAGCLQGGGDGLGRGVPKVADDRAGTLSGPGCLGADAGGFSRALPTAGTESIGELAA